MYMAYLLGQLVLMHVEDATINVSMHNKNLGELLLTETLPSQFTPHCKHYSTKTIWFRDNIFKRGIKLINIDTCQQLGYFFAKGLLNVTFKYLENKLMGS